MENKNFTIVLIRVISMVFIILCHVVCYYKFIPGSNFLGQIFNVGVYTFFIISGYLYGNKEISDFKFWIKKRWCKIVIPIIVLAIINIFLLSCIGKTINPLCIIYYSLNIQGVSFISDKFNSFFDFGISNLAHLWFATIIMLCYCLIPVFQKSKKFFLQKSEKYEFLLVLFLFILNFIVTTVLDITLIYFIVFYFGYIFANHELEKTNISNKKYILVTSFMLCFQIIRLLVKFEFDQTNFYTAIVGISHFALGFWIFITLFKIREFFPQKTESLASLKIVKWLDENSYYVYLTHGMFCIGESLNVFIRFDNIAISSVLFLLLTFGMTYLLAKISNIIIRKCTFFYE